MFLISIHLEFLMPFKHELDHLVESDNDILKNFLDKFKSIELLEQLATTNECPLIALSLAYHYKQTRDMPKFIQWFHRAYQFALVMNTFSFSEVPVVMNASEFFASPERVSRFLDKVDITYLNYLFSNAETFDIEFIELVAQCEKTPLFSIGSWLINDCINRRFITFLSHTTLLKTLELAFNHSDDLFCHHAYIGHLAEGLAYNTSVETLKLSNRYIGDEGVKTLLHALIFNKQSKLRVLDLRDCGLSDEGALALLKYVEHHANLEIIGLEGNHISQDIKDKISEKTSYYRELANPELIILTEHSNMLMTHKVKLLEIMDSVLEKLDNRLCTFLRSKRYLALVSKRNDFMLTKERGFTSFTQFIRQMVNIKDKTKGGMSGSLQIFLKGINEFPEKEHLLRAMQQSFIIIQKEEASLDCDLAVKAISTLLEEFNSISVSAY